jgi:hypothetical protein
MRLKQCALFEVLHRLRIAFCSAQSWTTSKFQLCAMQIDDAYPRPPSRAPHRPVRLRRRRPARQVLNSAGCELTLCAGRLLVGRGGLTAVSAACMCASVCADSMGAAPPAVAPWPEQQRQTAWERRVRAARADELSVDGAPSKADTSSRRDERRCCAVEYTRGRIDRHIVPGRPSTSPPRRSLSHACLAAQQDNVNNSDSAYEGSPGAHASASSHDQREGTSTQTLTSGRQASPPARKYSQPRDSMYQLMFSASAALRLQRKRRRSQQSADVSASDC